MERRSRLLRVWVKLLKPVGRCFALNLDPTGHEAPRNFAIVLVAAVDIIRERLCSRHLADSLRDHLQFWVAGKSPAHGAPLHGKRLERAAPVFFRNARDEFAEIAITREDIRFREDLEQPIAGLFRINVRA